MIISEVIWRAWWKSGYLISIILINLLIFRKEYKLLISSLCRFFHTPLTASLLGLYILETTNTIIKRIIKMLNKKEPLCLLARIHETGKRIIWLQK